MMPQLLKLNMACTVLWLQCQIHNLELTCLLTNCSFLASEFKRQARCDIGDNKRAKMKLSLAAERCKHSLSTMISAQCAVESLYEGMDFHYNMSRARFESLIQPLISKCTELIDQALAQAGCVKEDISKVIICGGG